VDIRERRLRTILQKLNQQNRMNHFGHQVTKTRRFTMCILRP
jgi:hypothetical protein